MRTMTTSLNATGSDAAYRVRRLGFEALRTPGARRAGLIMLLFAGVFARWFESGEGRPAPAGISPFTYPIN